MTSFFPAPHRSFSPDGSGHSPASFSPVSFSPVHVGRGWQNTLHDELQKERRRAEALFSFAEEGEEAAQETVNDLACERALRLKANARIAQLEDLLGERDRDLDDACIEFRKLEEEALAKDLHVQDLDECLRMARRESGEATEVTAKEHAQAIARLADVEQAATNKSKHQAECLAEAERREQFALQDLARERDLRFRAEDRIDGLDKSIEAHGREMEDMASEFQALQLDVSTRDRCIQDLEGHLQAATSSLLGTGQQVASKTGTRERTWEHRCSELQGVLSTLEAAARTSAAEQAQRLLQTEASEMRVAAKLQSSELGSQRIRSQTEDSQLQSQKALSTAEKEKASLQNDVLRLQTSVTGCRCESTELQAELTTCRTELSEALAAQSKEVGAHRVAAQLRIELATCRSELADASAVQTRASTVGSAERPSRQPLQDSSHHNGREVPSITGAFAMPYKLGPGRRDATAADADPISSQLHVADAPAAQAVAVTTRPDQREMAELPTALAECRSELADLRAARGSEVYSRKALRDLGTCTTELAEARWQLQNVKSETAYLERERLAASDSHRKLSGPSVVSQRAPFRAEQVSEAWQHPENWRMISTGKAASQQAPLQVEDPDESDVDIAVHAAALHVAVRSELEAARRAARHEMGNLGCQDETPRWDDPDRYSSHDSSYRGGSVPVRREPDVRTRSLTAELKAAQARDSKSTNALEASLRALREESRVADGLRAELDVATTSCAAARAARNAQIVQAAWEVDVRSETPPRQSAAKRLRGNSAAQAAAAAAGAMHRKSVYNRKSSPRRPSMLRLRIEEEAKLRLSLGLCN